MVRQNFVGMVTSHGKMDKTVKVRIQRMGFNKLINKYTIRFTDFLVHDEANKCKEGDVVRIQYVRPLSARKSFSVTEILSNKGQAWIKYREEAPEKVQREELALLEAYKEERAKRVGTDTVQSVSQELELLRKARSIQIQSPDVSSRSPEDSEIVSQVMSKYGFDQEVLLADSASPLFNITVQNLRQQLDDLNIKIQKQSFAAEAKKLLEENPKEADRILRAMGKSEPQHMKNNIKKNLLMKHFVKTQKAAAN